MKRCVFSAFFKPSWWCPWEKKKEEKKGLKSQREDFYHLDVPPNPRFGTYSLQLQ